MIDIYVDLSDLSGHSSHLGSFVKESLDGTTIINHCFVEEAALLVGKVSDVATGEVQGVVRERKIRRKNRGYKRLNGLSGPTYPLLSWLNKFKNKIKKGRPKKVLTSDLIIKCVSSDPIINSGNLLPPFRKVLSLFAVQILLKGRNV